MMRVTGEEVLGADKPTVNPALVSLQEAIEKAETLSGGLLKLRDLLQNDRVSDWEEYSQALSSLEETALECISAIQAEKDWRPLPTG